MITSRELRFISELLLPKAFAGLIQAAVLYVDYIGFYLINGWLPVNKIWMFTLIFVVCFAIIWFAIYITVRLKVVKVNKAMENTLKMQ